MCIHAGNTDDEALESEEEQHAEKDAAVVDASVSDLDYLRSRVKGAFAADEDASKEEEEEQDSEGDDGEESEREAAAGGSDGAAGAAEAAASDGADEERRRELRLAL